MILIFLILHFPVVPISKAISIKKLNSSNTELIPYGKIGSTTGIRLNNWVRNITPFSSSIESQLIGHLLGDGSIHFTKTSVTPYFVFTQTQKRFDYVWFVFQNLSHQLKQVVDFLCLMSPNERIIFTVF